MSMNRVFGRRKCGRCGLQLSTHTDAKCSEILRLEREALLNGLEEAAQLLGSVSTHARETLEWVKNHKAHEVLERNPFYGATSK